MQNLAPFRYVGGIFCGRGVGVTFVLNLYFRKEDNIPNIKTWMKIEEEEQTKKTKVTVHRGWPPSWRGLGNGYKQCVNDSLLVTG